MQSTRPPSHTNTPELASMSMYISIAAYPRCRVSGYMSVATVCDLLSCGEDEVLLFAESLDRNNQARRQSSLHACHSADPLQLECARRVNPRGRVTTLKCTDRRRQCVAVQLSHVFRVTRPSQCRTVCSEFTTRSCSVLVCDALLQVYLRGGCG
jgi:hypothetical protein